MCRTKSTARRSLMVTSSSSSSANQEEAPTPNRDAASFSAVSQRRGGVPS